MAVPTRRQFPHLHLGAAAFAGGVVGCTSSHDSEKTHLNKLLIENYDTRPPHCPRPL